MAPVGGGIIGSGGGSSGIGISSGGIGSGCGSSGSSIGRGGVGRGSSTGGSINNSIGGGGGSSVVVVIADPPPDIDSDSDNEFFDALSESHCVECQIEYLGSHFDHFDLDSESGQSSNESELEDNGLDQFIEQNNVNKIYSPLSTMISQSITEHKYKSCISEECTIPGVTCQALYSPLFMYNFHHFLNLSTFLFMYLTEIAWHLNLFMPY